MKKLIILLFVVFNSYSQETINAGGGNIDNRISYSIGQNLIEIQISFEENISINTTTLNVPKFEIPKKLIIKKKNFLENLIEFIKTIFKKQK